MLAVDDQEFNFLWYKDFIPVPLEVFQGSCQRYRVRKCTTPVQHGSSNLLRSFFPDDTLKPLLGVFDSPRWRCVLQQPPSRKDSDIDGWRCLKQNVLNLMLVSFCHEVCPEVL